MKTKEELLNTIKENTKAKWIKRAVTGAIISGVGVVAYSLGKSSGECSDDDEALIPFDGDNNDDSYDEYSSEDDEE